MRLKAVGRITIKNNVTGEMHKIEIIPQPMPTRRFWLRMDGKNSRVMPEASLSKISVGIRVLLGRMF